MIARARAPWRLVPFRRGDGYVARDQPWATIAALKPIRRGG
ncbi:hypothetical protein ACRAWD_15640 [Caulobacter segnis]